MIDENIELGFIVGEPLVFRDGKKEFQQGNEEDPQLMTKADLKLRNRISNPSARVSDYLRTRG